MKRGRNQRRRQGVNINRALDSNGPDVRIRGTANQIYDKYLALARDANSSGDRVKAENYLQHAEHYFRMIRAMQPQMQTPHMNGAGEGAEGEGDQPVAGEDRRFHREQPRFDQPQPGYAADDDDDDVAPPPSRFDGPSFGDDTGEQRRHDHQQHQRHDNRQDRHDRQDNRGDRGEQRAEGRPEHRGEGRPDFRAEGGEGGGFNDRRGRRRRRPRPPMGGEPRGGDAPEAEGGGEGNDATAPETV